MSFKSLHIKNDFKKSLQLNAKKVEFIKKLQTRDSILKRIAKDFLNKMKINENRKGI